MTEKITITQKQANAIERLKEGQRKDFQTHFKENEDCLVSWARPLAVLSENEYMSVLYDGYEVEPEPLKVGDWAKSETKDGRLFVGKIRKIDNDDKAWSNWNDEPHRGFINLKDLEKCTPEEITAEQERQKWAGIEEGDVLIGTKSGTLAVLVMNLPEHSEVQVRVRNHDFQTWDKESVELYAKKVGEPIAKAPSY